MPRKKNTAAAVLEREVESQQPIAEPVDINAVEPTEQAEEISQPVEIAETQQVEPQPRIPVLNSVRLVGRVGADPDLRYFETGSVKSTLSLAVNRPVKNSDPDWFSIELWDKNAETAANYVRKGSQIGIEGRLEINTWKDPQGNWRSRPIIKADRLHLLARPSNNGAAQAGVSSAEL